MNRYVMGDIHGRVDAMEEVFKLSGFDFEEDELIQIGDICDRGLYSYECVEKLKKVKHLILIQGNHDYWFKQFLVSGVEDLSWYKQGGEETLESYHRNEVAPVVHKEFYDSQVPYHIDQDNNCFVHGGWNRDMFIKDCSAFELCWNRSFVNEMMSCTTWKLKTKENFQEVFIGHTPTLHWYENELVKSASTGIMMNLGRRPVTTPIIKCGVVNVDTGSGKGGKLTLLDIDTKEFFQSEIQHKNYL